MAAVISVIVAHPDDDVLGCGGTIIRHIKHGDEVHVIYLTDGVSARDDAGSNEVEQRLAAAKKAAILMGGCQQHFLKFPDNQLDQCTLLDLVKAIEGILQKIKPSVVYTHHSGDLNIDHELTHRAVMTACRPQPETSVKQIYSFEILSSTGWFGYAQQKQYIANKYIDISAYLEQKLEALRAYDTEMREVPHARSYDNVEYLAKHRGASVGLHAAETFFVERWVEGESM
ncbi:MAG: PIG-L family deacetylase [Methylococcales bacterium]|jgi:N-acetylglucosamine malate deacetylase 1|nr:PIG-L family deacetylase [Methylococcales bacterium]MBT7445674.1 PIG-L family deacetylase [Methylococcales bacterium]